MADAPITTNRSRRVKRTDVKENVEREPQYKSIDEVPVNEIIKQHKPKKVYIEDEEFEEDEPIKKESVKRKEVVQPSIINISDVASLLNSNSGSGYYDIDFPTLGKTYRFKQITVAQQRTLSKNSLDFKNRSEQMLLRCSLLKSICLSDEFEPLKITWAEYINALLIVRNNNFIDDLTYNITCDNKDCGTDVYQYTVDLDEVSQQIQELVKSMSETDKRFEFKINDNDIVFHLEFPTMEEYVTLAKTYSEDVNDVDISLFLYPYIKGININGSTVDISPIKNDINQFIEFIDNTFVGMSFKQFANSIAKNFEKFTNTVSTLTTTCPVCKTKKDLTFDLDDFFTL